MDNYPNRFNFDRASKMKFVGIDTMSILKYSVAKFSKFVYMIVVRHDKIYSPSPVLPPPPMYLQFKQI